MKYTPPQQQQQQQLPLVSEKTAEVFRAMGWVEDRDFWVSPYLPADVDLAVVTAKMYQNREAQAPLQAVIGKDGTWVPLEES